MLPNPAHALDSGTPVLLDTARAWPAASDVRRWMLDVRHVGQGETSNNQRWGQDTHGKPGALCCNNE